MAPQTALDPLDCYELCVQSPRHVASFLRGLHGNQPIVLGEDFCGRAALSREWCRQAARAGDSAGAVGADLDIAAISAARELAAREGVVNRLRLVVGDVTDPALGAALPPADVIFVGNFSIGYIHARDVLVRYLVQCRRRLEAGHGGFGGGVLACDTYGGSGAYKLGGLTRVHPSRGREMIRYHWVHEAADPLTGIVENSISFRVEVDGEVVREYPRAFTYRWRLWAIHELREAMREAGFRATEVYRDVNVAPGASPRPVVDPGELGEDWIVVVAART